MNDLYENMNWTLITFGLYLLAMAGVGLYFYFRAKNIDDYLLGGRGMGSWVTALSAQASDMSGWLLMGLPGAIFCMGMGESWIAVGLLLGTLLNWLLVAPRLRLYTEKTASMTLSSFFSNRFRDKSAMLRSWSAILTLFFFVIYAASGLVSAGKLFHQMFGIDEQLAVLIGTTVMIFYTMMGGFLAVCWTDLFQGALMFVAIVVLPVIAFCSLEPGAAAAACEARTVNMSLVPEWSWKSLLAIFSAAAWGFGYFGQPHILVRFMSIKSIKLLPRTITIAMIWVVISLAGAVAVGILAIPMFPDLAMEQRETVFILMIRQLFHPALGGILLAAILAAVMSTIDSQLLVSGATLTEDFYRAIFRRNASDREQLVVSRLFVLAISIVATVLAMRPNSSIFGLVTFAWGGFGAAFGPIVLAALFLRRTTAVSAICGMVVGTAVLLGWVVVGFNSFLYEIVPGFVANFAVILLINAVRPQNDPEICAEFDEIRALAKSRSDLSDAEVKQAVLAEEGVTE